MTKYTYRVQETGEIITLRQKFGSSPLTVHPETGKLIVRVITGAVPVHYLSDGFTLKEAQQDREWKAALDNPETK